MTHLIHTILSELGHCKIDVVYLSLTVNCDFLIGSTSVCR